MYSKHAEQYAQAVQDNVFNANFERPSLQSMLGDLHGKSVLDLGCGSGVYASYLLQNGASSVTCIDASPSMIDIVNKTIGGKVNAYTQNLSQGLPKEEANSTDVIICPLVVHYIEDLSQFFIEIHRVLKTNGYMVFSTHNPVLDFTLSPSGNYFKRELITEEWNTIGEPVEVSFYRRPLSETFNAITNSGLVVSEYSEGKVTEKLKNISPTHYEQFSTKPQFMFIKCQRKS
jgi:2-polyprenyl-3-methyl-5-hydroxy-6-metoxy-1,4-benzoquinol methylase